MNRFDRWSSAQLLGQLSIFRWSYGVFVVVPIAARVCVRFGISAHDWPFNVFLFYLSSCSFMFATALYSLFCPPILKSYRHYSDFQQQGRSVEALLEAVHELKETVPEAQVQTALHAHMTPVGGAKPTLATILKGTTLALRDADTAVGGLFWALRDCAEQASPRARRLCLIAFAVGCILMFVVAMQNVEYVVQFAWNGI